jgi:oligopeptide transport system permease protein
MSEAIGPSFFIGSIAVFFSYLIGIPLGVECARFRNKKPDSIINSISTILIAVPSLVIVIVIFLFSDVFGGSILYVTGSFSTRF